MSWKEFTPQELFELKKNPYVKSVTIKMVRFTVAFKEKFWEQYQDGKSPNIKAVNYTLYESTCSPERATLRRWY